MEKIVLEIPKEDIEEVVHLLRYACCSQPTSNSVWTLLMPFCDEQIGEMTPENFAAYPTKHSNK